jgi:uncharacterized SAM-binding protein YcdF (DUF218 family)
LRSFRNPLRRGRLRRGRLRRRWLRRTLAGLLTLLLVWLVAGYFLIVSPSTNKPQHVDAILVLGPPNENGRFALGLKLIAEGYSTNLVVSSAPDSLAQLNQLCLTGIPNAVLTCFPPNPSTTRGEAQYIERMATARGWKSLIVVTSTYHISRARTVVGRCFDGKVLMVKATDGGVGLQKLAYEYFYQTGAWIKALIHRSC